MKKATAVYIISPKENKVLLAIKQKFVGVGKRFPYGGKIKNGETREQCTVRETKEESGGIEIKEEDLIPIAVVNFYRGKSLDTAKPFFKVLFYVCEQWKGFASDTEEMKDPKWYDFDDLPVTELKDGDEIILSKILKKEMFIGNLFFHEESEQLFHYEIGSITDPYDLVL